MPQCRVMPPLCAAEPHRDTPPQDATLPQLFEAQSARTPESVAVVQDGHVVTYGDLNARANQLAHCLIDHGVGPEHLVAVALPRSIESVVASVAVVKSGGAVLPLDPGAPEGWLDRITADARPAVVLGDTGAHARGLPAAPTRLLLDDPATARSVTRHSQNDPCPGERGRLTAEHAAWVSYPRGGECVRGAVLTHDNLVGLVAAETGLFGFGRWDVWALSGPCAGDRSLREMWGALLTGGSLVVVPAAEPGSPEMLDLLARERVTLLTRTSAQLSQLVGADRQYPGRGARMALRHVFLDDVRPQWSTVEQWRSRHAATLTGTYGSIETTVHAAFGELGPAAASEGNRVRCELPECRIYVLDSGLRPVPPGSVGIVYVAGEGLIRGYLGRRGLTGERFVADPYGEPGARMFRTGELARWCADGSLELLGGSGRPEIGWDLDPAQVESVLAMVDADPSSGAASRPVPRWAESPTSTVRATP